MFRRFLLVLAALAAVSTPATAQSLQLGKIGVGGTGCPAGSVSAQLGNGGKTISLKFRSYQASAGGARSFDRKACGIAIPVVVPPGLSVAVVGVDYRGASKLPAGASAVFSAEYFFAGSKGQKSAQTIKGPASGRFTVADKGTLVWSGCGTDVNFRVNTSLRVNTTGGRNASVSLRTQDVSVGATYRLQWKAC